MGWTVGDPTSRRADAKVRREKFCGDLGDLKPVPLQRAVRRMAVGEESLVRVVELPPGDEELPPMVRDTTPDYVEAAEVYGVELERVLPVRARRARLEAGRRPGESLEPRRRRDNTRARTIRAATTRLPDDPRLTGGAATARLPGGSRLRGEPLSAGLRARGRARRGDKDVPRPRRNLLGSPVAAAAVSAEYPRRGRGAAATRLHRKTLAEYSDVRPGRYKKELEEGDGWDKPGPDFDASATVFSAQWMNAAGRSLGPVEGLRPAVARRPLDGEAASAAERARPPLAPTARARRTSSLRRE